MPHSDRHNEQKAKNYTLLAVLLVLIAILFTLPFLKLQMHGTPEPAAPVATEAPAETAPAQEPAQ